LGKFTINLTCNSPKLRELRMGIPSLVIIFQENGYTTSLGFEVTVTK